MRNQEGVETPPGRRARTSPRRKWLWAVLFTANLAVYLGACALWTRLASGQWVSFTPESFRASLVRPMADTLTMPLPTVHHPWMVLVYGFLVALFVFVPVGAAIAYRLTAAVVFALILALVAHAVALALAVAVGCVLIAYLRRKGMGPVPAASLGLIAPVLLLLLVAYAGLDTAAVQPIQRWIPVSWLLVAAVASVAATMAVATICRFVRIRRGILLPLQLGLLAGAGWMYLDKVGRDELAYALLQRRIETPDTLLAPRPIEAWMQAQGQEPLIRPRLIRRLRRDVKSTCRQLTEEARPFLSRFPKSRHVPRVLWMLGQCHSLQPNEHAVEAGQVKFVGDWPQADSLPYWSRLVSEHPAQPQAALARWRIGEMALRQGQLVAGFDQLLLAQNQLQEIVSADSPPGRGNGQLFLPVPPLPAAGYYNRALSRVTWLLWIIHQNKLLDTVETRPGEVRILAAWLQINPYRRDYGDRLRALLSAEQIDGQPVDVSASSLADNIRLALAKTLVDPVERAEALKALAETLDDAAIGAHYELGRLLVQDPRLARKVEGLSTAREYFSLVAEKAIVNPWKQDAQDNLQWLTAGREDD
jgi:hypothetical protein